MPKQPDFTKDTVIKDYIKDVLKIRSSQKAITKLTKNFNSVILAVIKTAAKLAREANRKTILLEDITQAYEKHIGKEYLTWDETLNQILRQPPADLGKISKGINDYIEKH